MTTLLSWTIVAVAKVANWLLGPPDMPDFEGEEIRLDALSNEDLDRFYQLADLHRSLGSSQEEAERVAWHAVRTAARARSATENGRYSVS